MSQTIEIIVSPTGQTSVQTKGFTGATCQEASRFIEQELGSRQGETLTSEFYQNQTNQQRQQESH